MSLPFAKPLAIALLAALPVFGLLAAAPPARAQIESREGIALRDQILELRHELDALRAQIGNNGGSYLGGRAEAPPAAGGGTSDMVVRLLDRMNTLEDEIRRLRGRVDELQNDLQQQTADLGKQISDLKFEVENPGAPPSGAAPSGAPPGARPPPPPPAPPAGHPAGHPAAAPAGHLTRAAGSIAAARAALARRDYAGAERSAHAILARRAAPDAYAAQFVMAEALAGQHQWSRAAIAYDDAYNRSKKGPYAPAALVGLAESLAAINEHRAACETLAQLHHEFPREGATLRAQATAVARRAACR